MRSVLFLVSLMLATTYGQLLLAQNSNGNSNSNASDVKEIEVQQQPTKELEEKPLKKTPTTQKAQAKVSSSKNKAPNKVFIPTEEISEDKPVAFPVDI